MLPDLFGFKTVATHTKKVLKQKTALGRNFSAVPPKLTLMPDFGTITRAKRTSLPGKKPFAK